MSAVQIAEGTVYPGSVVSDERATYFLARLHKGGEKRLGILGEASGFAGTFAADRRITFCPLSGPNAAALRARLPWLRPSPLGPRASFGFGDRIGSATPGHIRALRAADPDGQIAPIFAQQSVRENARTGRTPQQVIDDAMWGIFQEGWRSPWGADADHVKEIPDLDAFVRAGYTFYTVDPSDQVDHAAQDDSLETLRGKAADLPWGALQSSLEDTFHRYSRAPVVADAFALTFDEPILLRALAKYGRALAHTITFAQALVARAGDAFDLEMSVDETASPTSVEEHFFLLSELTRCGVKVVSLAPRFVGTIQKGIDYIGNAEEFERELIRHAAIVRHFGGYKLSLHTGSDKFRLYPALARHGKTRVHVKTAGTSYLEALRVVAAREPALFRRVLDLARRCFESDRKTYSLDARLSEVPSGDDLADSRLPGLLESLDARQVLHVTFGSILVELGHELGPVLAVRETEYYEALERHFIRHLSPFSKATYEPE